MGILENVDVKNLQIDKFRHVECPCEFCEDGCFDRTKQVHSTTCKKKLENQKTPATKSAVLTHYQDIFKPNYDARPATCYRPPPDKFDYVPSGKMEFSTVQKAEFKPPGFFERQKSFKITDNYEKSKEPFDGLTCYRAEYSAKENHGLSNIVKRNSNESTIRKPVNEKISSNTTSKDHFKYWEVPAPTRTSYEYPSYAGEALFPTFERSFTTHTKDVHRPISVSKNELRAAITKQDKDNLKPEGDIDLLTNYRDTFVKYANPERAKLVQPTQNNSVIAEKLPMKNKTQTMSDFIFYTEHQPPKPAPVNPFISDLDKQIYPGTTYDHNTIYNSQYQVHDIRQNPKPKAFNPEKMTYEKPTEKLETETVTMRDFKPIDVTKIPAIKAVKITSKLKTSTDPMETVTMNKIHFVPYKVTAPALAKDPIPYYYIPPREKFNAQTTNMQMYKGEKGPKAVSCKPDFNNVERGGEIDLRTSYQNDFIKHGLTLCESKAYLIAKTMSQNQELKAATREQAEPHKITN